MQLCKFFFLLNAVGDTYTHWDLGLLLVLFIESLYCSSEYITVLYSCEKYYKKKNG
jgi:hypothetical protein